MEQLRHLIAQQADAMKRFESHSQHFVSQQQEEYAHKQHTQFQQFNSTQPYATPVDKKTLNAVVQLKLRLFKPFTPQDSHVELRQGT